MSARDITPMGIMERRFREQTGERFLSDGRLRCHATSKTKRVALGEELGIIEWTVSRFGNKRARFIRELTEEESWPRCQCRLAAINDTLACGFHGGNSEHFKKFPLAKYMPLDLAEKVVDLAEGGSATLLDRSEEIFLLKARNAELFEKLQTLDTAGAMYAVAEGLEMLRAGELVQGRDWISSVLRDADGRIEKEIWDEIRQNNRLIESLSRTQLSNYKEMQQLHTTDQVIMLMDRIIEGVDHILREYIEDEHLRSRIVHAIGTESFATAGFAHGGIPEAVRQTDRGDSIIDGETVDVD